MPDITLHRSTADPEYWYASAGGTIIAEGAYADVKSDAKKAAAPRGRLIIGPPMRPPGPSRMMVQMQQPKTVDTGKGIAGGVAGKPPKSRSSKKKAKPADEG